MLIFNYLPAYLLDFKFGVVSDAFRLFLGIYFFPSFLLKTFSISPFQGQYPNIAVRINTTPISPTTQHKTPSMEKAKIIKMIPMIERKIASAPLTFFVLTTGSMFFSLGPY